MNNDKIYYSVYDNFINPYFYIYNENEVLIQAGWVIKNNIDVIKKKYIFKKCLKVERELDLYFKKKLRSFTLPTYDYYKADSFSQKVENAMKEISFGGIKTYGEIAGEVNNPKAFRAVGSICRKNKFALIIPCHRVVAKNFIGGYMGKKEKSIETGIKRMLLEHEGNIF